MVGMKAANASSAAAEQPAADATKKVPHTDHAADVSADDGNDDVMDDVDDIDGAANDDNDDKDDDDDPVVDASGDVAADVKVDLDGSNDDGDVADDVNDTAAQNIDGATERNGGDDKAAALEEMLTQWLKFAKASRMPRSRASMFVQLCRGTVRKRSRPASLVDIPRLRVLSQPFSDGELQSFLLSRAKSLGWWFGDDDDVTEGRSKDQDDVNVENDDVSHDEGDVSDGSDDDNDDNVDVGNDGDADAQCNGGSKAADLDNAKNTELVAAADAAGSHSVAAPQYRTAHDDDGVVNKGAAKAADANVAEGANDVDDDVDDDGDESNTRRKRGRSLCNMRIDADNGSSVNETAAATSPQRSSDKGRRTSLRARAHICYEDGPDLDSESETPVKEEKDDEVSQQDSQHTSEITSASKQRASNVAPTSSRRARGAAVQPAKRGRRKSGTATPRVQKTRARAICGMRKNCHKLKLLASSLNAPYIYFVRDAAYEKGWFCESDGCRNKVGNILYFCSEECFDEHMDKCHGTSAGTCGNADVGAAARDSQGANGTTHVAHVVDGLVRGRIVSSAARDNKTEAHHDNGGMAGNATKGNDSMACDDDGVQAAASTQLVCTGATNGDDTGDDDLRDVAAPQTNVDGIDAVAHVRKTGAAAPASNSEQRNEDVNGAARNVDAHVRARNDNSDGVTRDNDGANTKARDNTTEAPRDVSADAAEVGGVDTRQAAGMLDGEAPTAAASSPAEPAAEEQACSVQDVLEPSSSAGKGRNEARSKDNSESKKVKTKEEAASVSEPDNNGDDFNDEELRAAADTMVQAAAEHQATAALKRKVEAAEPCGSALKRLAMAAEAAQTPAPCMQPNESDGGGVVNEGCACGLAVRWKELEIEEQRVVIERERMVHERVRLMRECGCDDDAIKRYLLQQ